MNTRNRFSSKSVALITSLFFVLAPIAVHADNHNTNTSNDRGNGKVSDSRTAADVLNANRKPSNNVTFYEPRTIERRAVGSGISGKQASGSPSGRQTAINSNLGKRLESTSKPGQTPRGKAIHSSRKTVRPGGQAGLNKPSTSGTNSSKAATSSVQKAATSKAASTPGKINTPRENASRRQASSYDNNKAPLGNVIAVAVNGSNFAVKFSGPGTLQLNIDTKPAKSVTKPSSRTRKTSGSPSGVRKVDASKGRKDGNNKPRSKR